LKKLRLRVTKIAESFNHDTYLSNILILSKGTLIAQVFPFITSLFLTRFYTTSDFGLYTIFMSITSILSVVTTFGLENLIFLSNSEIRLHHATVLSLSVMVIVSLILSISIVYFIPAFSMVQFTTYSEGFVGSLIFFYIVSSSISTILNVVLVKKGHFKFLSNSKILFAIFSSLAQLTFAMFDLKSLGLIYASMSSYIFVDFFFIIYIVKNDLFGQIKIRYKNLCLLLKRYRKFSLLATPAALISVVINEIPVFMISRLFGESVVGLYSFGYRLVVLPLTIVSNAFQDVFRKECSDEFNRLGDCRVSYMRTFTMLLKAFVFLLIGYLFVLPLFFDLFFNNDWKESVLYIQIISPFVLIRALSSILSYPIFLSERMNMNLFFLITLCILTVLVFYVGSRLFLTFNTVLNIFSIINIIMYLIYLKVSYNSCVINNNK
jgi:lipopolysaccharide exporter